MPNFFSYVVLVIWPIAALLLVRGKDRDLSAILLFLVPYLILPVKVKMDFPLIPPLDKDFVASFTAMIVLAFKFKNWSIFPENRLAKFLIILIFLSPIMTVIGNGDRLFYGETTLPELPFIDVLSMVFAGFAKIYVPFMAGYNYINEKKGHRNILVLVSVAVFIYSVLALWEIRMSPQLQKQIYGFFPHDWRQQIREGGFRPVLFLGHGLIVAVLISMGLSCSAILWKGNEAPFKKYGFFKLCYLSAVLVLCKTYAAIIYGLISVLLIVLAKPKTWLRVSVLIAIFVTVFPILRSMDLVPTERLTQFFSQYSEERASSLQFRFDNESLLLNKANERSIYGWGGWNRSRVFNENGVDISTTDGYWIVIYGARGWLGYASSFGLLSLPILAIYLKERKSSSSIFTCGICLVLSVCMIDLIPNSSISSMLYLLSGSLLGMSDRFKKNSLNTMANDVSIKNSFGRNVAS